MSSMKTEKCLCFLLGICGIWSSEARSASRGLTILQQWSQLEFDYPSYAERQSDIDSGLFIPGIPVPLDVDVYYSEDGEIDKLFITSPRWMKGSPISLGTVSDKVLNGNPIITPYPSWDWHRNPEYCKRDRIVSVFRTIIDECGRLWIVDNGVYHNAQICPAQILAFDLKTDTLVHRHEMPLNLLYGTSLLVTPVVDVRDPGTCQDTFVYVADCKGFALFVHDVKNNVSWKVQDKTMYPYPTYGTYTIAGDTFDLLDGNLGMALSPYKKGEDRLLYFHAMSSSTENWVYTSFIRNQTLFASNPNSSPQIFHTYPHGRNTQSAAEVMNKDGIMFFGLMTDIEIVYWDSTTDYTRSNFGVISNNPITDQFVSGIKIIKNKKGEEELWLMASRFHKTFAGTLNPNETNFRIQTGRVIDLIDDCDC